MKFVVFFWIGLILISILAVAEGALSQQEVSLSKKEWKAARATMEGPSISYRLANEIAARTGQEIHIIIPGHSPEGRLPLCL